ncbi:SLATT domain-containing protein [Actinomadura darangshiensis]|nr:SLATT domain-containing protein [Actinomadura darangshiensis]
MTEIVARTEEAAIEELLGHNRKILTIRNEIRSARRLRFVFVLTWFLTAAFVPAVVLVNIFTWGHINLTRVNIAFIPVAAVLAITTFVTFIAAFMSDDGPDWDSYFITDKRLELEIAEERKRLYAAKMILTPTTSRHVYREAVPQVINSHRVGQKYYRRVHNLFQSIIIIGSLASSTIAGLADIKGVQKWILVAVTFTVGVASGFTGYFKFRERGFYLQQTADAIDEEISSLELRVGHYKKYEDADEALGEFAERVESIRSEQRKREQQLDQPTENQQR